METENYHECDYEAMDREREVLLDVIRESLLDIKQTMRKLDKRVSEIEQSIAFLYDLQEEELEDDD